MTPVMKVYQLQMIITSKENMDKEIQDEVQEEVIAKAQGEESRSSIAQEDLTSLEKLKMKIIVRLIRGKTVLNLD